MSSYVDFSAIHPKGNSWVEALHQMIEDVAVNRPTISTAKPIGKILNIFVDGKPLENSKYSLISTDKVEVLMQEDWPATIGIQIQRKSLGFGCDHDFIEQTVNSIYIGDSSSTKSNSSSIRRDKEAKSIART